MRPIRRTDYLEGPLVLAALACLAWVVWQIALSVVEPAQAVYLHREPISKQALVIPIKPPKGVWL